MPTPQRPGEAITLAAQRLDAQRTAARALSQKIADERTPQSEAPAQEPAGGAS